jgi:triacylglycerol esterase/lipase EstA (alpha/beta hydrolase family)
MSLGWIAWPLGALVAARAVYVTATYVIYWYESAQRGFPYLADAGPGWVILLRALAGLLGEIGSSVVVLLAYPLRLVDRRRPGAPGQRRPVLLVHGMYVNGGALMLLRRRLLRAGWQSVHLLDLDFRRGHLSALSDQVAERIEEIRAATGADRVDAVGHSLGGIVVFHTLLRGGAGASLGTCIALGAPFHGTRLASFSRLPLVRQLAPGSPVLKDLVAILEGSAALPPETRLVSIWSTYDNIILPTESPVLPEPAVRNARVDFIGHLSLLFSRSVERRIARVLRGSV